MQPTLFLPDILYVQKTGLQEIHIGEIKLVLYTDSLYSSKSSQVLSTPIRIRNNLQYASFFIWILTLYTIETCLMDDFYPNTLPSDRKMVWPSAD